MARAGVLSAQWHARQGLLRASEPSEIEVLAAADALSGFYNDPHNARMLGHDEWMTPADVVAHYRALREAGGRAFLLEREGALVGDADLRRFRRDEAEIAILVGARSAQGQGLGTRFGTMVHALAFGPLALERLYASILPANAASCRLFARLGHEPDEGPAAREYAESAGDLTFSVGRARFLALHGASLARIELCVAGARVAF